MSSLFTRRSVPSQQQFRQAIRQSGDAWYVACARITNDADLAHDAVQDALLNAWRKREQFRGGARIETWIHRIAVNSAIALVRRESRLGKLQLVEEADWNERSLRSAVALAELDRDLSAALSELSEMERVCFVLKHLEEWRLTEIAEQLDSSTGSVKQALFRAVKKLRVQMAGLREET